ncbi:MAG: acyl-CoA dehydrogenase [Candidatus Obscuribacter sp.]|jgi:alkylation response protein AidB-like acyl-CoA dehydrogenase|nr:acyl-CoA dehydrogenase [Candidatus Obscuribacter sp.]MBK9621595.1 acyl-CoA dehydrogenase [Candidatus Obscuribacter sp.]MBK9771981.1 acyl-CoA dehydrogenase [Candidatus Obscuribacter sp.]
MISRRLNFYGDRTVSTAVSDNDVLPFGDFFTEEHHAIREAIRDFATREIAPKAHAVDQEARFPIETFKELGKLGYLGLPIGSEYGGAGADYRSYVIAVEEIGRACGSTGLSYAAHVSLGTNPIYKFGTEEQKKKYVPKLCSGEYIGCWALTEPGTGSDASAQKTTAKRVGDHYILNGTKQFITNATDADVAVIMAMTDMSLGRKGISCFIVEKDTPGYSVSKVEKKLGMRGSPTASLTFEDCKIPVENMIGAEGEGYKQALMTLEGGRLSIGALALGIAQSAFDAALTYAKQREAFGQPIGKFQMIQAYLADMSTYISAARLMLYHAAWMKDHGKRVTLEGSQAKLYASEIASKVCNLCVQIHGGYGYIVDFPAERFLRDAKLCEIGEGTSEIQRLLIARQLGL